MGRNFIGRRNCPDAAGKINDLWLYEQLSIAFLEDSAKSIVSEIFNMALFDSGCTKNSLWRNVAPPLFAFFIISRIQTDWNF